MIKLNILKINIKNEGIMKLFKPNEKYKNSYYELVNDLKKIIFWWKKSKENIYRYWVNNTSQIV